MKLYLCLHVGCMGFFRCIEIAKMLLFASNTNA